MSTSILISEKEIKEIQEFAKQSKRLLRAKYITKEEYIRKILERYRIRVKKIKFVDTNAEAIIKKEEKEKNNRKIIYRTIYMNNEINDKSHFTLFFLIGYLLINKDNNYIYIYSKKQTEEDLSEIEIKAIYFALEMVEQYD